MRFVWLVSALILCAALAALNLFAFEHYLYWKLEWYDVFMHLLGGVALGAFLAGFLARFRPLLYLVLFYGLVIAWELFEYYFGIPRESNYVFDTALDLLMGTLGALAAYALARTTLWRTH
jgi:glycopeptide antibiotics resistance protein